MMAYTDSAQEWAEKEMFLIKKRRMTRRLFSPLWKQVNKSVGSDKFFKLIKRKFICTAHNSNMWLHLMPDVVGEIMGSPTYEGTLNLSPFACNTFWQDDDMLT